MQVSQHFNNFRYIDQGIAPDGLSLSTIGSRAFYFL